MVELLLADKVDDEFMVFQKGVESLSWKLFLVAQTNDIGPYAISELSRCELAL